MTASKLLSPDQIDRAVGVIFGTASGELLTDTNNEWGQGTSLSVPVLEALGAGLNLQNPDVQGRIVRRWIEWALSRPDASPDTNAQQILNKLSANDWEDQADDTVATACVYTARTVAKQRANEGKVDCGALIGSGLVAIGFLHDSDDSPALALATRAVAALTDPSEDTAEACVIWAAMIRQQILTGSGSIWTGLKFIEPRRAAKWHQMFQVAGIESSVSPNGPAVQTSVPDTNTCAGNMLAAWMNVSGTNCKNAKGYLEEALNMKGKYYSADTVALTGSLVGAMFGGSGFPRDWMKMMHGWPGIVEDALQRLVSEAIEATATGTTTHAAVGAAPAYGDAPGYDAPSYDAPAYGATPGYAAAPGYTAPPPSGAPAYFRSPPSAASSYDAPPAGPPPGYT